MAGKGQENEGTGGYHVNTIVKTHRTVHLRYMHPLGLAQWKRASPRGEAGTSGLLSVSDSDFRVPAESTPVPNKTCFDQHWRKR